MIEVLIGIVIVTIASIATLSYFAYAKAGVGKQGNRRAALERARERLEEVMAGSMTSVAGSDQTDGRLYWLSCSGSPCSWTRSLARVTQTVAVDDLPSQQTETTVQWKDEVALGTSGNDAVEITVKVRFTGNFGSDDDFNRVSMKTLRSP